MLSQLRLWYTEFVVPCFALSPKETQKESMSGTERLVFICGLVVSLVPSVVTMPVIVKWTIWLACFIALAYIIIDVCHPMARLSKQGKAIVTLLVTIVFIVSCRPLAFSMWRAEQAELTEGDLIGAGEGLLPNGATPWVQVGDSGSMFIMLPQEKLSPYFKPFPDAEFLIESGKKSPLISTSVRDRFGNLVVDIKQNHWTVYPPYCSDKNYDKYALEVKDSSGHVLLQVRLVGGRPFPRVQVQGEWWSNEGRGLRIVKTKDGKQGQVIPLVPENQHNYDLIQELFKYPSKAHWRELR
jgi:hypothetical protein